jgi:hypothetical protein
MDKKIYAVITGDIVNSSGISGLYANELNKITNDIKKYQQQNFILEIYRGDSFQALVTDPTKAILISILIRTGLRRNSRGKSIENIWDARISIGIGPIRNSEMTESIKIGTLDGEAFVRSGKNLDKMKKEGSLLKINTGDSQLDQEFSAICPLVDAIISRWSIAQAEAVYLYLLRNLTQKEIGNLLNTSQRAISKRLEVSNIEKLKPFFTRFIEIIQK